MLWTNCQTLSDFKASLPLKRSAMFVQGGVTVFSLDKCIVLITHGGDERTMQKQIHRKAILTFIPERRKINKKEKRRGKIIA